MGCVQLGRLIEQRGRAQGVTKVGEGCLHWFLQVSGYLDWGKGRKMMPTRFLFLEKSPKCPCPSTNVLRLINKFPSHVTQVLFKLLLLCCISVALFVMLSL